MSKGPKANSTHGSLAITISRKSPPGFHDTCRFGQRFPNPLAVQVIDRIRTDGCVESAGVEGKFAHVSSLDGHAMLHPRGFQIRQQFLLRTEAGSEVLFK